ncbi:triose-phosphate isomerase [Sedimentitalea nanhaiensis]|uniref:Triosephosphate isomerase n=1 Tax=Sedimentitalea nanhaiensis TaxID=999627 RepID=A0A1I6YKD7_9RHOB|nr:triose-phosphate isomerase [Sedimentitalea nanhaiensis]SFT50827.1 triosephosphate isomerase [Sedimentitalea nanhaiensis]
MRLKLAAGNWKMNGTGGDLHVLTELAQRHTHPACELLICPPATLLHRAAQAVEGAEIAVGGQDCHPQGNGAYTGDISAQMLIDAGASAVILGHSERRQYHAEADETVCAKALAAQAAGLTVIVCVGESLAQREAAETLQVIAGQIAGSVPDLASGNALVIAYEPIWAIGTGLVPDTGQIAEVHDFMRTRLQDRFGAEIGGQIRLLYGGSVKATNAEEIFAVPNVDGALVGGASLTAADFSPIVRALESST